MKFNKCTLTLTLCLGLLTGCHFNYPAFILTQEGPPPFGDSKQSFRLVMKKRTNIYIDEFKSFSPFDDSVKVNYFWLEIRRADEKNALRTSIQLVKESFQIKTPSSAKYALYSAIDAVNTIGNSSEVWIEAGPIVIPREYKGPFEISFALTRLNMNPPYSQDTAIVYLQARYEGKYKLYPTDNWTESHR